MLSYVCSHLCALMGVCVCSHMCAFLCVLSSVLSHVCLHMSAFICAPICVLPYVCSVVSALMCSRMSAPVRSHLCVIILTITTTSLVSFCPPTLFGVSCWDIFLQVWTTNRSNNASMEYLYSFECHPSTHAPFYCGN